MDFRATLIRFFENCFDDQTFQFQQQDIFARFDEITNFKYSSISVQYSFFKRLILNKFLTEPVSSVYALNVEKIIAAFPELASHASIKEKIKTKKEASK